MGKTCWAPADDQLRQEIYAIESKISIWESRPFLSGMIPFMGLLVVVCFCVSVWDSLHPSHPIRPTFSDLHDHYIAEIPGNFLVSHTPGIEADDLDLNKYLRPSYVVPPRYTEQLDPLRREKAALMSRCETLIQEEQDFNATEAADKAASTKSTDFLLSLITSPFYKEKRDLETRIMDLNEQIYHIETQVIASQYIINFPYTLSLATFAGCLLLFFLVQRRFANKKRNRNNAFISQPLMFRRERCIGKSTHKYEDLHPTDYLLSYKNEDGFTVEAETVPSLYHQIEIDDTILLVSLDGGETVDGIYPCRFPHRR